MRLHALYVALLLPVLLFLSGMANAGNGVSVDRPNNDGKIAFVVDRGSGSLFVSSVSDISCGAQAGKSEQSGNVVLGVFDQAVVLVEYDAPADSGSMHPGSHSSNLSNENVASGVHSNSFTVSFNGSGENSGTGGGHSGSSTIVTATEPTRGSILSG